jgi:rubredoxin
MVKFRCIECSEEYDEENGDAWSGIRPDTKFADLPWNWTCPECGAEKDLFEPVDIDEYLKEYEGFEHRKFIPSIKN